MPLRPQNRPSAQSRLSLELRAQEELARRRLRAVGRCPACGRRVELADEWLRLGDEPFHLVCAEDEPAAPGEVPRARRVG